LWEIKLIFEVFNMNKTILLLLGILLIGQWNRSLAKEPKTVNDFINLLIKQQSSLFPRYTCEFEIFDSVVDNGRNFEQKVTTPKTKMRAARNYEDYAYKKIIKSDDPSWSFPSFLVKNAQSSMKFTTNLGIYGMATVSGLKDVRRSDDRYMRPDNYFGGFTREWASDPEDFKKWVESKQMIGSIRKVPLDWPAVQESIHLRLESEYKQHDIYFDPAQGYLPIKMLTWLKVGHDRDGPFDPTNPRLGVVKVLLESKKISPDRYFPMKVLILYPTKRTSDETGECHFLLHNITNLEVDKDPSEEDLSIPVPAGCLIETDLERGPRIKFRRPENVKPSDLPQIISMLEKERDSLEKTGRSAIQDTALIPPKPKWSRYLWWGVAALALLTLLNLVFYLLRKRTKEKTS
jgi:hypothetical protein